MQHSGHTKNKKRRERERLELRILVGGNLNQLGSLSGVELRLYESVRSAFFQQSLLRCH
jgi:vacuolar protein sorting-associated protein 35